MNLQIYEEASDWLVKHRDGGLAAREKKAFDAWLRESPHHMRAYLEMSSIWEDTHALDPRWNPKSDELIARARADENIVPLAALPFAAGEMIDDRPRVAKGPRFPAARNIDTRQRLEEPRIARGFWRRAWLPAVAASMLMMIAGTWFYLQRDIYVTAIGEQRSVTLADGSTVELNSRSRIKVKYSERERYIDLLEGQALFHVAKNKSRPFVVQAGQTRVRAVGTTFDVYKAHSGTVVTVVEGRVAVARVSDRGMPISVPEIRTPRAVSGPEMGVAPLFLTAGEQLVVTPAAVPVPKQANIASATAWTRHSLVFDASPLSEVAQEFNRYNTRRLVVADPQLVDFHVSGVFSSAEPTLLLRFLRAQPELVVEETDTEIRISAK